MAVLVIVLDGLSLSDRVLVHEGAGLRAGIHQRRLASEIVITCLGLLVNFAGGLQRLVFLCKVLLHFEAFQLIRDLRHLRLGVVVRQWLLAVGVGVVEVHKIVIILLAVANLLLIATKLAKVVVGV